MRYLILLLAAFSLNASAQTKKLSQIPVDSVDANTFFICIDSTGGSFSDFRAPIADLAFYLGLGSPLTLQNVTANGDTTTHRMTVLGPTFKIVMDTSSLALIDGVGVRQAELNTTSTSGELILRNSTGGSMVLVPGAISGIVAVIGPPISGNMEIIMPFNASATDANFIASGAFVTYILPAITSNRTLTLPSPGLNTTMRICNRNTSGNNWQPSGVNILDSNGLSLASLANPCTYTLQGDGTHWVIISK